MEPTSLPSTYHKNNSYFRFVDGEIGKVWLTDRKIWQNGWPNGEEAGIQQQTKSFEVFSTFAI